MIPDNLMHLYRCLALELASEHNIQGKEALELAATLVRVLQKVHGGDRLGSKGTYIPVPERRRNERIRESMGQPPYSNKRVREVMEQEGVSRATVWRALKGGA